VKNTVRHPKITVSADGRGWCPRPPGCCWPIPPGSRAWARAGWRLARLRRRGRCTPREDPHRPGDDAGAERGLLADAAVLRAQPELAGPVASDPVISQLVSALAARAAGAAGDPQSLGRRPRAGLGAGRPTAPQARTGTCSPSSRPATAAP
jgi:hypothetical protein